MKTILLIEENEMMRENTTEILELSSYRVFPVEDENEGFELALSTHPDIIICDMVMPQADAHKLLKRIRSTPFIHKIPFIFITANDGKTDINKNMKDGTHVYLSKPFEGVELLKAVEKCLLHVNHK
jgi:CRP/FNR family transcriptional regulator, cyclic AMP receptor protein